MRNLEIELEPRGIAICPNPALPSALRRAFEHGVLQHQIEVYQAAESHDIILDLAPTGTGKTKAGLSVLTYNQQGNAVYIAPTNALIEQQKGVAEHFVHEAGLPHVVKAASAQHVRAWPDDRVGRRAGEKLYNVLREPATLFPECGGGRPLLLVTNPDIFYYASFFQYGQLDRSNIASVFYNSFSTIIFDEFHLYNAKQLVSLLFYLAVSKEFGYFNHNRKVVLLTATPEPACEVALKKLEDAGIRIARIDGESETEHLIPSQSTVHLDIRHKPDNDTLLAEVAREVTQRLGDAPHQYGAVILDSLDLVNRLNDRLCDLGRQDVCGRITGVVDRESRHQAAQKQVILATSTVDVGFNFERDIETNRQNLDWLIFSARERFAFWQRMGRVGRVLGKSQTDIASSAIVYLPEKAWEQGIENLDCSGGREGLKQILESLECMDRPFLTVYWQSEAFLEIARPLLELEIALENLPQENLITQLYQTLSRVFNGKRDWEFYRHRMRLLKGAEAISSKSIQDIQKSWKYISGGQSFVMRFFREFYPEDFDDIHAGSISIQDIEKLMRQDTDLISEVKTYADIFQTSYSPIFSFRDSLFQNLRIYDPNHLLLDHIGETNLDPIHLLRFYEFEANGDSIEVIRRAVTPYDISFHLDIPDYDEFRNTLLNKLYAFKHCHIRRMQAGSTHPTPCIDTLEKQLIPGVIVSETSKNRWAIIRLKKQGLECYPMSISSYQLPTPKQYLFFPSLSGILALASVGVALTCADEEEFYIV